MYLKSIWGGLWVRFWGFFVPGFGRFVSGTDPDKLCALEPFSWKAACLGEQITTRGTWFFSTSALAQRGTSQGSVSLSLHAPENMTMFWKKIIRNIYRQKHGKTLSASPEDQEISSKKPSAPRPVPWPCAFPGPSRALKWRSSRWRALWKRRWECWSSGCKQSWLVAVVEGELPGWGELHLKYFKYGDQWRICLENSGESLGRD